METRKNSSGIEVPIDTIIGTLKNTQTQTESQSFRKNKNNSQ
jgi:hypothetical protein